MEHRDRASGWKHAKISGHKNEDLVKQLLDTDPAYADAFIERIGCPEDKIADTSVGGLHETNVASVNGRRKTKSKTDLKVFLESGREINLSVKKSLGGQVYFVRAGLFIDTFEKQFKKQIPEPVQRAICLFWAAAPDAVEIIEKYGNRDNINHFDLQIRHKSLNASTLMAYDEGLYHSLIAWFRENAYEISMLCFSMGAAADPSEWAHFIWYKNLLGESDVDALFSIKEICSAVQKAADTETYFSSTNGGTTIQLPFGFVQWHQRQLQFHHNYEKIKKLVDQR